MTALFSDVTDVKFARRELLGLIIMFDFTMGDVHRLPRKFKSPVEVTYLPALALWKQDIEHFHGQKIGPDEMECNDGETTIVNPILCTDMHRGKGLVWLNSW